MFDYLLLDVIDQLCRSEFKTGVSICKMISFDDSKFKMMLVGIEYEVSDRNVTRACEKHRNSFLFPLTKKTKKDGILK